VTVTVSVSDDNNMTRVRSTATSTVMLVVLSVMLIQHCHCLTKQYAAVQLFNRHCTYIIIRSICFTAVLFNDQTFSLPAAQRQGESISEDGTRC